MKTLNTIAIALVLMASACFAQVTLSTTTLGAAVTTGTNNIPPTTITLASTSTMQNEGNQHQPNTVLYADRELMNVVTVVDSTHVIVQRGKGPGAGGVVTNHPSGGLVYFANTSGPTAAPAFFSNVQTNAESTGACTTTLITALPRIYVYSGDVFQCYRTGAAGTSGQWVKTGSGSMGVSGSRIAGFCTGTVGSAESDYLNGAACSGATTATARQVVTSYGNIANLRVFSSAAATGTGGTATTVYKNGSSTAITCSFAASATTCSDLVHSVQVAPGDVITFLNVSATSDGAANVAASVGLY